MSAKSAPASRSRKILILGPNLQSKCTVTNPDCLKKPGLTVIGDGLRGLSADEIRGDFGKNPTIYFSAHGVADLGRKEFFLYTSSRELISTISATQFLKLLGEKLGPDSTSTIVISACEVGPAFLKKAAEFLPPHVTLITTARDGKIAMVDANLDYVVDTIFETAPSGILRQTICSHGLGVSTLRNGKITTASPPELLLPQEAMKDHLRAEFVKFGLDPSSVTDDQVTQYGLGMIFERGDVGQPLSEDFLKSIISSGIDVNAAYQGTGFIALRRAGESGDVGLARTLLAANANPNIAGIVFKQTPLLVSTYNGYTEIVKILLDAGAQTDVRSTNGATPLHFAVQKGHTQIVKDLLAAGADHSMKVQGFTALDLAISKGHIGPTKALLKAGAIPTADLIPFVLRSSYTPQNKEEFLSALLEAGAKEGLQQAFDFAITRPDRETAETLIGLCLDNGFRPENPPKFRKFVTDYLAKKESGDKESGQESSAEFVVDARGGVADSAPTLTTRVTYTISTTPAASPTPSERITSAASTAAKSSALTATPQSVSTTVPSSTGIAAASSLLTVLQALVTAKHPDYAKPYSKDKGNMTVFIDPDDDESLPKLAALDLSKARDRREVVHQTEAEREFALKQKIERRARDAETASKQPSPKPINASFKPASGKPGKQGHR